MTILPRIQEVSMGSPDWSPSWSSGIRRNVAMMTDMLPNAITLRTATLRRKGNWQLQMVEMGRMRIYRSKAMF